jgi:hypothetical protein
VTCCTSDGSDADGVVDDDVDVESEDADKVDDDEEEEEEENNEEKKPPFEDDDEDDVALARFK